MLRFAPRYGRPAPRNLVFPERIAMPMNDNAAEGPAHAAVTAEALRLFTAHGSSAASRAGELARVALLEGDEAECDRWLAVCRLLDRRMAREIAARRRRGAL